MSYVHPDYNLAHIATRRIQINRAGQVQYQELDAQGCTLLQRVAQPEEFPADAVDMAHRVRDVLAFNWVDL